MILAAPLTLAKKSPEAPLFGLAAPTRARIVFTFANHAIDEGDEE
jgi:hypothetical protein